MTHAFKLEYTLFVVIGCVSVMPACDGKMAVGAPATGGTATGGTATGAPAAGGTAVGTPATGGVSSGTTCEAGTERCECYGNGACNAGLTCASDLCVRFASTAAGGAVSLPLNQGGMVANGLGGAASVLATGGSGPSTTVVVGASAGGLSGVAGTSNAGGANATSGGTFTSGGVSATTGGSHSTGGTSASAGNSAIGWPFSGACTPTANLIQAALTSTYGDWIGEDGDSTLDNPCGVQGSVYAYSDRGIDGVVGDADDSVQSPGLDTAAGGETRLSPCSASRNACCITGITSKWPGSGGTTDYTASVWGGGLGVSLNDPGAGETKRAYEGSIKGLNVTISGTLNGQALRVGYTQSASDACPPFVEIRSVGTYALPFVGSVTCPTWSCSTACIAATQKPYDLQLYVVGGDVAGAFDVCITAITPII